MARLDVYKPPGSGHLLDAQASKLVGLTRRVVRPLVPLRTMQRPVADLQPVFLIREQGYVVLTQRIASVPKSRLGPPTTTLAHYPDEVTRALDVLLTGF
jgi:toxin CcdB